MKMPPRTKARAMAVSKAHRDGEKRGSQRRKVDKHSSHHWLAAVSEAVRGRDRWPDDHPVRVALVDEAEAALRTA